jgi:hypothetical protein
MIESLLTEMICLDILAARITVSSILFNFVAGCFDASHKG